MSSVNINLNTVTKINYIGLRKGNAFGFKFKISVNGSPIVATDYTIVLTIEQPSGVILKVNNADWTKSGDEIEKLYTSFPIQTAGTYPFDLTWTDTDGNVVTVIPGTIQIINRNA
jgi:hypothetical protein